MKSHFKSFKTDLKIGIVSNAIRLTSVPVQSFMSLSKAKSYSL